MILNRNEGFVALVVARYAAGNPRQALGMVKQWVRSRPDKLEPIAQTRVAVYYGTDIVNRVLADAKIGELLKDAFGVRAVARLSQQIAKNKTYEEPSGMFETRVNPKDGAEMALIPAGEFLMGDEDISDNPRRAVRLSGYWMYKKPVTVGQYKKFCQDTARKMPDAPSFNPDWARRRSSYRECFLGGCAVLLYMGGNAIAYRSGMGEGGARHGRAQVSMGQRVRQQ